MTVNSKSDDGRGHHSDRGAHTTRVTVPATFYDDHADRCAAHHGKATEVRRAGQRVTVDMDAAALANLFSDACYYADRDGPDDEHSRRVLRPSARATLAALAKVQP